MATGVFLNNVEYITEFEARSADDSNIILCVVICICPQDAGITDNGFEYCNRKNKQVYVWNLISKSHSAGKEQASLDL